MIAGKVRFANEAGVVARPGQRTCKTIRSQGFIKVDPVVMHAAGERQHARQQCAARRHAHHIWRDARRKTGALLGQQIQVRRLDAPPFKAKAVSTVLITHDQQNIGLFHVQGNTDWRRHLSAV